MKILSDNQLDRETWDAWLTQNRSGHFLQSWEWGNFQLALGNPVWRLAVVDGDRIINQLLVVRLALGFGWDILYSPRGNFFPATAPIAESKAAAALLLARIKDIAAHERVIAFRIDPEIEVSQSAAVSFYRDLGFVINPGKNPQPKHTTIVDLNRTENQIFASFHPKTRYNIRLAERHGIVVKKETTHDSLNKFTELVRETSAREHFTPLKDNYYHLQFENLLESGMENLWLAYYQGTPIAGILTTTFNRRTTYIHGGSDKQYRALMAPHLLQHQAIQAAKADGSVEYDLWGIHPDPAHPWAGFTRFKRGFDGVEKEYIGTLEMPLNPFIYKLYRWLRP